MGYGRSETSENLQDFGFKAHADAISALCAQLNIPRIIIGGHDWGGMTVYRVAQWYPDLVTHVFSVCTAFAPPTKTFTPTEALVNGPVPQFGYQLQLGSDDQKVEKVIKSEHEIRKFLLGMYGGRTPEGRRFMTAEKGIDLGLFDNSVQIAKTPLFSDEVSSRIGTDETLVRLILHRS
jgi:pimeloyl-ACP methyl ester carboxylesterase